MSNFVLTCGSICDLSNELLSSLDVKYIPYHFYLDDKEYIDDLGKSFSNEEFYNLLKNGANPKTSQVTVNEYILFFEKFLSKGKDILHIAFSSGLSGSYNSAMLAKNMLEKKYPDRKIYIVDSLSASSGCGLLVTLVANKRKEGANILETFEYAEKIKYHIQHWFFSTDLKFYIKGGRVSKASGFIGSLLRICPILEVNKEGKLIPRDKIISATISIIQTAKKIDTYSDPNIKNNLIYISHSNCLKFAQSLKNQLVAKYNKEEKDISIFNIGPTIGSHTGPGTVALFFVGKEREI